MKKLTHDEIAQNRSTLKTIHTVRRLPVYGLLNSIRSNYNVGSIFRTSDAVLIEKLFLCGYTPYPPRKEIEKTALGATESVPWEYVKDPKDLIIQLKERGVIIAALELTDNSIPYYNFNKHNFPLCLIIGNEITGVSQDLLDLCDISLEIPQFGIKQSLNAAVAYGVSIFALRKIFDEE